MKARRGQKLRCKSAKGKEQKDKPIFQPVMYFFVFERLFHCGRFIAARDSVQLWTQGEADVDALTLCQLIVHHYECFHLGAKEALECVLSAVRARSCGNQSFVLDERTIPPRQQ